MAKKPKMSVVKEMGNFCLFMAAVICAAAYFVLTGLKNAPEMLGIPRAMALGIPLVLVALLFVASGILVLAKRSALFVGLAMGTPRAP